MDLQNSLSQSTVPLAFTIFGLLLFLLVLSSISRRRTAAGKAPPEASGAWPLIGHLHLLGGSKPPHVTLGNMADKYGPVFTLRLGVHRTLIVSNWEMAKECFTVNDKTFASRPKSVAFEVLGYNFAMFGFSPYGSYWRHVRKIATTELLSTKRIEMLKHVIESEVKTAIKESYDIWLKMNKRGGSENAVTELNKWFGDMTLNVMFRLTVGKRLGGVNCDDDHEENERIQKAVREFFDLSGSFVVSDALPYLRWLDLDGKEKEMKRTAKELDSFVQVWLEEHKRNRNSGVGEWKGKHDFMDALLSIVDESEQFGGCDADTVIKATCLTQILAGTDTTTGTLTWALSLLLNNREVLNKAIHELDTQIGRDKMVVESDLQKLEYLQAILKETLRLYPAGPLSLPHESMEDCTVGGYHVPAGTRLFTNISKIQRDPLLYPHPLEFRPERFLTTHKDIDVRDQHFELIPFSAGRRMCPGLSFALHIMQLTLATLLHGFDIVTPDGGPVDMLEHLGASINMMPLSLMKKLGITEIKQTRMTLQLADRSIKQAHGVVEDVLVKVDKFLIPVDFVILDIDEDTNTPMIFGRPFLATSGALIDVPKGELILRVEGEQTVLKMFAKEAPLPVAQPENQVYYVVEKNNEEGDKEEVHQLHERCKPKVEREKSRSKGKHVKTKFRAPETTILHPPAYDYHYGKAQILSKGIVSLLSSSYQPP